MTASWHWHVDVWPSSDGEQRWELFGIFDTREEARRAGEILERLQPVRMVKTKLAGWIECDTMYDITGHFIDAVGGGVGICSCAPAGSDVPATSGSSEVTPTHS